MIFAHSNIILIGMMGVGKTTVGRKLAAHLGYTFIDTDQELVEWTGRTIPDIFLHDGEAGFRQLEAEIIQNIARNERSVIATGGGIVLRPENVTALKEQGWIIYLSASPDVLMKRLQGGITRPLLQDADPGKRLRDLLQERLPLYRAAADWEISTDHLTPDEVVNQLVMVIREHRKHEQA